MHTKQNVIEQLQWIDHCNYKFYTDRNSNGSAAVYKADVTRLLDDVDWTDKNHEIDTDEMQINLNAAVDNFADLPTLMSIVELEVIDPIRKWSVAPMTKEVEALEDGFIEIGSSHGQVYVFTDGTISRFENDEGKAEFGTDGIGITKFDLSVEALEDGFADILNVGYWHANGYEPAFTEDDGGGVPVINYGPVIEGQTIGDKFGDQS